MELCSSSSSSSLLRISSSSAPEISFSPSISRFSSKIQSILTKPRFQNLRICASVTAETQGLPRDSPQRLLKELGKRKTATGPKKKVPPKRFILRPPLDDKKLAERFLNSPQLSLKSFPLLISCLPSSKLNNADKTWIDEYLLEVKQALGYSLEPSEILGDDNPAKHFDTLLYLAFQHPSCDRARARHVKNGHSRLWFLGQYVLELALIGKRSVFWALFGAICLCYGMPEVYRVLFEVFGMDPDADECQPRSRRQLEDVDYVSVEFEGKKLGWQDIATYKPPEDALFAHPRLFRACVPLGMHRFRGNIWDFDSKPKVMQTLGYPLPMNDRIKEITEARNIELGLGLQVEFDEVGKVTGLTSKGETAKCKCQMLHRSSSLQ
ncbi:ribonuclease III domain-containing protein RNC1, chloroplastic [Arabidopsis lyrata subsp. lyrata]|uniref:ribonuclease III domain-containing protein RNC1, chloroplastic n=1 Tax=Arabidopsis lyrata subsp. lyrata TaxID=81972 RepID=UPI000A29ADF9|nr:ribonuclease III domain-containing protein RNC1, chloroplastic [Arabidopsis lyrata subsp. lyrata]|eukprot:XP_020881400.1 ribonuclease III domain-containing protein RNC1, chloroplastic [Arabidopsis lyrata subsp. lyrata]